MSSDKFDILIDEFPEETAAVRRLAEVIQSARSTPGRKEWSSTRLYDLVAPSNYRILIQLLTSAASKGILHKSVRVESSSGLGGIGDYNSIIDIPDQVYDSRIGRMVNVDQDQLRLVYSVDR